jgi:hypothetical protein
MAGRGPQSFKKRQKEQQRKEKQQEKLAKRAERVRNPLSDAAIEPLEEDDGTLDRMTFAEGPETLLEDRPSAGDAKGSQSSR